MATESSRPPASLTPGSDPSGRFSAKAAMAARRSRSGIATIEELLFTEGFGFDFFQAMRLMEKLEPGRRAVGREGPPAKEAVRLRTYASLEFPPSAIHEISPPTETLPVPTMVVAFMGLTGPSGVLPRHYTEMLIRLQREARHAEKFALRDWLDLFNHRLISLFYRAWEKYRFYLPYERQEYANPDPDTFTLAMFSLIGMGQQTLRNRLRVAIPEARIGRRREKTLAQIDDLGLLRFGGFFAHRPRNAISLQAMLSAFLQLPVRVDQLQGQWLKLESSNMSALGENASNNSMGLNAVVGDRVWNVQSKIRIRIGPLTYAQFQEFLPDRSPVPERKKIFLLAQLIRLYVGPELDIDVQLVLAAKEVPACRMATGAGPTGARIGWNTWSRARMMMRDADEPVFEVEEGVHVQTVQETSK